VCLHVLRRSGQPGDYHDLMQELAIRPAVRPQTRATRDTAVQAVPSRPVAMPWIRAQSVNISRHAAALRPFTRGEFGAGAAAPSEGHLQAVNQLLLTLRSELMKLTRRVSDSAQLATQETTMANLQQLLRSKELGHGWVQAIERIWDFYFELFGQRQSQFADWLLSCDRIALDCYQVAYTGLGVARSIPAPPPFCYVRTGFSPATFRRGIPLRRLGRQLNPFPLIQLPYHRMVNPWTLGAVLHEVSHNLQSDLGLSRAVPRRIAQTLLKAGLGSFVASVWTRWNREVFADLSALLLGGPSIVGSLMDVVGRSPAATSAFNPSGVHPTPYLRTLLSIELLRRMWFPDQAERYRRLWTNMYPTPTPEQMPPAMVKTFPEASAAVLDAICFQPYRSLGNRSLREVIRFQPKEEQMVEEAARRLAAGTDPGIIPARFLIGATRVALDQRMARPGLITKNFYTELARR
jgi:hypothetical protein